MRRLAIVLGIVMILMRGAALGATGNLSRLKLPSEFTAQITVEQGASPARSGTLYFSHGRIRTEMIDPGAPHPVITIVTPRVRRAFLLMPADNAFAMTPFSGRAGALSEAMDPRTPRVLTGSEIIGGEKCDKYEIESKDSAVGKIEFWISQSARLPVRMIIGGSNPATAETTSFSNAKAGRVPETLFVAPPQFRQLEVARPASGASAPPAN
ncbi:MAG TPA: DUF4412 domain-containing protein [Candidatus Binataceae bacterium]|nr:DUF4412 domain-containing protein [Candidatus Binataceae bacterium]